MKKICLLTLSFIIIVNTFAEKFAGIEIGGKGIKVAVVDILDVNEGRFTLIKDWTVNTAVTKGISSTKMLAKTDIVATANAVGDIYTRLQTDYSIPVDKIFIAGSSGVAIATNTSELKDEVKNRTGKDMFFISSQEEGKLVTKGAVPAKRYTNSLVWDIGGGNSKGGYVLVDDAGYYNFFPMAFDYGCVTLTEKIRTVYNTKDYISFKDGLSRFLADTLKPMIIKQMFDNQTAARRKNNLYAIGGASFAFTSLMFPEKFIKGQDQENYVPFKSTDVQRYYLSLLTDYDKLISNAQAVNPDNTEKVLNLYSPEALLVGATILYETMNQMDNKDKVNGYFVRKGQVAWIIAYVVDYVRKKQ
jgi:exopolyphosphatase/pppGpp-phosphohydrolase